MTKPMTDDQPYIDHCALKTLYILNRIVRDELFFYEDEKLESLQVQAIKLIGEMLDIMQKRLIT